MKTIAVDIDEVLMPHFQDLIKWYNRSYGTSLTLSDNHPKDTKGWGTDSRDEAIKRVHRFLLTDEFKNSKPFEEAKKSVRHLAKNYLLIVVTSRDTLIEKATRHWLDEHFPELFKEAHFTGLYSLDGGQKTKADIAKASGAEFIIDDSYDHIMAASEVGINGLLFGDYPWNNHQKLPNNVVRVKNWQEVEGYFDTVAKG